MSIPVRNKQNTEYGMAAILLAALVVRLLLVTITDGYSSDVACFSAWAMRMAENGPTGFYAPDYFADYPPGYMLVLGAVGKIARLLGIGYGNKAMGLLLSVIPIACDLATAALIGRIAVRYCGAPVGLATAASAAFCPALLYDTGIWKQMDGVLCFLMVACFWLLCQKKWLAGAAVYGLALAVKPQPLLLGPALAVCFAAAAVQQKTPARRGRMLGTTLASAVCSVGVVVLCSLPFWPGQPAGWLLDKYTGTVSSYPYASVNGFGLLALLGGNWRPQEEAAFAGISWQVLGMIGIGAATAGLVLLAVRGLRHGRVCPLVLAAFYGTAVFALAHRMHERYVLPAVLLTLAAAVRWNDRRMLGGFWVLSFSSLLNQAIVLTSNGTEDQFLTSDTAVIMIRLIALFTLAGFALVSWGAVSVTGGKNCPIWVRQQPLEDIPQAQPRWNRREGAFLAVLTLLTAFVSLWGLGDFKAPQNPLDAIGTVKEETFELKDPARELWLYTGITWNGSAVLLDEAGRELAETEIGTQGAFKWTRTGAADLAPGRYTIRLENSQLMEIALRTPEGAPAAVAGGGALLDEQALVPDTFSYRNSTYFDEIYHGRTAYEHLHGMPVYETTHPPLGKVFIMLGAALFGMTGFGWRVSGTLFGIAMVPVMYLFVRRLTRSRLGAGVAAVLLALDGLRFAQSRISTIDVYGAFFILLAAYFMVWYCQSVLTKGVCKSILPMALAGITFGLGAASKWTGLYAGAGLAVLYFGVLWQRWRQRRTGFGRELAAALIGGVLFFVLIPLALYIGAYFPYWWREGGFGLAEWWQCQLSMFSYHSRLVSTHPFESRWYTWPFAIRPVWYYLGSAAQGLRSTISGMASPLVVWVSTFAIGFAAWRQVSGRKSFEGGALLVLYLAQLLPWVPIGRSTFFYHYFPSLLFAVAAIGYLFSLWEKKQEKEAKTAAAVLTAAALFVFVWFYPALSGLAVSEGWIRSLRWLSSWPF